MDNVLLQTVTDINEALLQLIDTVHTTFIHSPLHSTSDLIIHWSLDSSLGWPEVRTNEVRRFLL